ncbi:MAG: signal recognition particle protein [Candidatus Calescibacterium sp.]|nr:signal recognition particle protein [Candidatus Calescibacterium sp.]MDW8132697.1 signal recognition particle protein [Candidatus Calescibacterium sp.]
MFEKLVDSFSKIVKNLSGKGKISKEEVEQTIREIRIALLEADVHLNVVRDLTLKIKEEVEKLETSEIFTPSQLIIRSTRDKIMEILGGQSTKLEINNRPSIILMVGLQGSGKTTTTAKLANYFKEQGYNPLVVAADFNRPAAIDQLVYLSQTNSIPVIFDKNSNSISIIERAVQEAKEKGYNPIIVDTAGRIHVDQEVFDEIKKIKSKFDTEHTILVIDSMIGQEGVNVAQKFDENVNLSGFIITKMDGDTRGGIALSIRYITGKPLYFMGVGEKITDLEVFHPDRIVSRILGMGDILTFIEKIEKQIEDEQLERVEKYLEGDFTFEDYLSYLKMIKKMGDFKSILSMLPLKMFGIDPIALRNVEVDPKTIDKIEAIINSMTKEERKKPDIINSSRKARIARGSGTSIKEVNNLIKHFREMRKVLKKMGGIVKKENIPELNTPFKTSNIKDIMNMFSKK